MLVAVAALFFVTLIKVASLAIKAEIALSTPRNETQKVPAMEKTNLRSAFRLSLLSHSLLETLWAVAASSTAGALST